MQPLIPADVARCAGADEPVCADCARRLQLQRDSAYLRHYPRQKWVPVNGACAYKRTGEA